MSLAAAAPDAAAKEAALSEGVTFEMPGHEEPSVFGIWVPEPAKTDGQEDGREAAEPEAEHTDDEPRGRMEWLRINPRTLRRRLYQRALEFFIHREAARTYKDARDLVTAQVMQEKISIGSIRMLPTKKLPFGPTYPPFFPLFFPLLFPYVLPIFK